MNTGRELHLLLASLCDLHNEGDPRAALATITRTHGSSFRRAGTHMLVRSNGKVVCELSGGCPQRDIVQRALGAVATGQPQLVNYNADSGLDVLIEMGCGGELEVLIEPFIDSGPILFSQALQHCIDERSMAWMATWFAIEKRVVHPRRLVSNGSRIHYENIGDPLLLQSIQDAIAKLTGRRADALRLPSSHGVADVLIEPIPPPHALTVIGCSATARALLPAADALGWQTTLVDISPLRLQSLGLPPGSRTICAGPHDVCEKLALDAYSSVVVMTHNLEQDMAYLAALRAAPVAYLGALGSRERAYRIRSSNAHANRFVYVPAGLDIGSETPAEIAVSVVAEITSILNGRTGGPLSDRNGNIH